MVVVGADVHKQTHTFVAVDEVGREFGHKTFPATTSGHQDAVRWARERFGRDLKWAIEDCRHLSTRLERDLLTPRVRRQMNGHTECGLYIEWNSIQL